MAGCLRSAGGAGGGRYHEEAFGKTVGLIGFGHIGRTVAARARAFGMRVMAVGQRQRQADDLDRYGTMEQLPELLRAADFVAVVCPLTAETRGMIAAEQLRLLKPSAYLINVARAEIIDEAALYEVLSQRQFAGAALDVWYQYPSRPGEVTHGSRYPFHELEQVIVTPHFSAWTKALVHRRCRRIAENLDRLARGEPLERVVQPAAIGAHLA